APWCRCSCSQVRSLRTPGAEADQAIRPENGGPSVLVLTRKSEEAVMVGGSVGFEPVLKVTVLEIANGRVRLGFEVDAAVPVHRLEVWERIRAKPPPHNGVKASGPRPG